MYTKFQKYILDEIEELGEFPLLLLIPKFLEIEENKKVNYEMINHKNYDEIPNRNFNILLNQVKEIFIKENLSIYKLYVNKSKNWDECFEKINYQCELLKNKKLWASNRKIALFIRKIPHVFYD